jgi:hypothetical protein
MDIAMLVYFMNIGSILRPFDIFYGQLVYFVVLGTFFPVLVNCTEKNLATLLLGPLLIAQVQCVIKRWPNDCKV